MPEKLKSSENIQMSVAMKYLNKKFVFYFILIYYRQLPHRKKNTNNCKEI